jgi:low affinity Fe/Cu permease
MIGRTTILYDPLSKLCPTSFKMAAITENEMYILLYTFVLTYYHILFWIISGRLYIFNCPVNDTSTAVG